MKVRSGFVSNSSSSSFIMLMKPEDVKVVQNDMPDYVNFVVDKVLNQTTVFGIPALAFESWSDRNGNNSWEYYNYEIDYDGEYPTVNHKRCSWKDDIDEYVINKPNIAWDYFYAKIKERGFDIFTYDMEM